jgi:CHAT domain-containing protein
MDSHAGNDWAVGDQRELEEDLGRIGLGNDLVALIMKPNATRVPSFSPSVLILPQNVLISSIEGSNVLGAEAITLGLRQSIDKLRPHGPTILLGETLLALSRSSRVYDSSDTVLDLILEAMNVFREVGANRRMGRAYIDLSTFLQDRGEYYDALRALDLGHAMSASEADFGAVSANLYRRSTICRRLDLEFEALRLLDEAIGALPESGIPSRWRLQILSERVANRLSLDENDDVVADIDELIRGGVNISAPLTYRARIAEHEGRRDTALDDYCHAAVAASIEILTNRTARFQRVDRSRLDFVFQEALRSALAANEAHTALALIELSNTAGAALQRLRDVAEVDQVAIAELKAEAQRVAIDALSALTSGRRDAISDVGEIAEWIVAQRAFLRYRSVTEAGRAPSDQLAEVDSTIRRAISGNTSVVEFAVVKDSVWVFAVTSAGVATSNTGLSAFELEILRTSFSYECAGQFKMDTLRVLGERLLMPIESTLRETDSLVIVPDRGMYGIPVHSLEWHGKPLVRTHDVAYCASALDFANRVTRMKSKELDSSTTLCIIAVPSVSYSAFARLPGVSEEAESVARLFKHDGASILLPEPTSNQLLSLGQTCDILHVACHGQFETRSPFLSRLMLGDRPVFAFEIATANIDVELVVMSACKTAAAESRAGGYNVSLASAFQEAGARSVLASFWPIDDEVSATMTERFYRFLLDHPRISPARALCQAQRSLLEEEELTHPYFWAPMAMFGAV